jgi:hypothetical protein
MIELIKSNGMKPIITDTGPIRLTQTVSGAG